MVRTPTAPVDVNAYVVPHGLVPKLRERLRCDSVEFDLPILELLPSRGSDGFVLSGWDYSFPIGNPDPFRVVPETKLTETVKDQIPGGGQMWLFGIQGDH
jgi:hypothetical protein